MKNNPEISIILAVYNVEPYIKRCLDSIIMQKYNNYKVLLVDDGSTDLSGDICDEYCKKYKNFIVYHIKNRGVSYARNFGVEKSNSDFICFVDPDDYVEDNYLDQLVRLVQKYDTKMSMIDPVIEYDKGKKIFYPKSSEYVATPKKIFEDMLYARRDIDNAPWGKLYKRELFKGIKYPINKVYEDTATTYKLVLKCDKIAVFPEPLYHYMKRGDSITQNEYNDKKLQLIDAVDDLTSGILKVYPDLKDACDRKMMWAYLSTLSQLSLYKKRNKEIEKRLMGYIKSHRKKVFRDMNTPKRDKTALIVTIFGSSFYRFVWRLYFIISGRTLPEANNE